MTSELSTVEAMPPDVLDKLPPVLRKAFTAYQSIRTYEDVERFLLKGNGYSPNTIRSYLTSFKAFTEYTGAPTVFDVHSSDLERWFDVLAKGDPRTAALRLAGVRAVYRSLERVVPESSPFNDLPERLEKKLKGGDSKRLTALRESELRSVLKWQGSLTATRDVMNHGIFLFLVTCGLRASEALSLTWDDIEEVDGEYFAKGIGKGGKAFYQELYPQAVGAVRAAWKLTTGRTPSGSDSLFLNEYGEPMAYHTLWRRIKKMGSDARAKGIIKREFVFSPHLLRRTYATVLHGAGMSARAVQGKTRHSNMETLTKHYLKNEESARPYLDKLLAV